MAIAAVFQIGSLGDSLVSVPTLRSIRELLPDVAEYLLITRSDGKQGGRQQKVSPRQVFDMAWPCRGHATYVGSGPVVQRSLSVLRLLAELRWLRPKYAVYLMPSDRTAQQVERDRSFFRTGGVGNLVGFRTLLPRELAAGETRSLQRTEGFLRFRRLWGDAAADRYPKYLRAPLITPSPAAVGHAAEWLRTARRYPRRSLIAFAPFANWESKNLPAAITLPVAGRLEREFGAEVVFLGGGKDRDAIEAIRSQSQSGINACGVFSVEQSAALLTHCALLLGVDSGPMHLAAALGVPTVAVFSRISQDLPRWFPLGGTNTLLYREVDCAGCEAVKCPVPGHPCIAGISEPDILAAVASVLQRPFSVPEGGQGTLVQQWDVSAETLLLGRHLENSSAA